MNRPLIIAHRGLVPGGSENSLSGARLAASAGADLIELDIRLSLDRKPVVMHDASLRRTTRRGRGWVALLPSQALGRLRLATGDGAIERVPLLRTLLRSGPAELALALHLKDRRALLPVLRLIEDVGIPARTWLWLDRTEDVHLATRTLPEVRCTLLRPEAGTDDARERYFIEAQVAGASAVSIPWGAVTRDVVHLARQHSLKVFSLEREDLPFAPAIRAGLDGVITNDPAGVRERLDAMAGARR